MKEPTKADLENPAFNAIWNVIKHWDIETVQGDGYHQATGTDVMAILDALRAAEDQYTLTDKGRKAMEEEG